MASNGAGNSPVKEMLWIAFCSFAGLAVSNFFYQFTDRAPNWWVAAERSYYQFVAIALFAGLMIPKMRRLKSKQ